MRVERRQPMISRLLAIFALAEIVAIVVIAVIGLVSYIHAYELEMWARDAVVVVGSAILVLGLCYLLCRCAIAGYRRRFRFSLRELLAFTALVALFMGTLGQQAIRYHSLHRVLDAGASFGYGPKWQESKHPSEQGWIESRLGYDPFRRITSVQVNTNEALLNMSQHTGAFRDVECVVCGFRVTDSGLLGAEGLARLPGLCHICLYCCIGVSDSGLERIARCSQVESLTINGLPWITDEGLAHLARMTRLKRLSFYAENPKYGVNPKLSDAGLRHLSQLSRLESLSVVRVGISDAGLSHLAEMRQLKEVTLLGTAVTENGSRRLQAALPNCKVVQRPE